MDHPEADIGFDKIGEPAVLVLEALNLTQSALLTVSSYMVAD
ncbi:hypothetical protein [Sphingomonas bacterium]|nr:hypothetical protein [Sphingomonas bacterium]